MKSEKTEVLVFGAGPGGYTAAFRAADLGKRVTLLDRRDRLGGVCLNVGCIPSKALLHVAEAVRTAEEAATAGITFSEPEIDLEKITAYAAKTVTTLTGGLASLAKRRDVTVLQGTGRFDSPSSIVVESSNGSIRIEYDACILAAGSRPVKISQLHLDDERVWDSTDALSLPFIPERFLVVGGGIIGLEMATIYSALGSEITIVEMMDQIIPPADKDLIDPLTARMKADGITIRTGVRVEGLSAGEDGITAHIENEDHTFDAVLIAVGRRANSDSIGIENAGIDVDERKNVSVDDTMRTNIDGIYAVGDITGPPQLAHKAAHEGKVAAEVIAGVKSAFIARAVPSVAYTYPEVAWTGLTESQAKERKIGYRIAKFPWSACGRALTMGYRKGLTKLLFDEKTDRIIGAGIVGPNAGELIAEATLAIEMGSDAEDIGRTIHPHPTLSETIGLGAEVRAGTVTDI